MKLTLYNGVQINLDSLDNLLNQEVKNNFLRFFDKKEQGGNANNIFDKNEIEKVKQILIEMAGADGKIDQNEIEQATLKYKSIFGNYTAKNMSDDLSLLDLNNIQDKKKGSAYVVKSGDTLSKIVLSLGYTGEDAKKYQQALDEELMANGSYMNDKKWLMAGKKINLLSEEKVQELGIHKSTSGTTSHQDVTPVASIVSSDSTYVVKTGDTLSKIVFSMGYRGEEAKKYQQALDEQLMANGSYMNDKKWLMAGKKILLLDDTKLEQLGITKREMPGSKGTDNNYVHKSFDSNQTAPVNQEESFEIIVNSPERILSKINANGQNGSIISEEEAFSSPVAKQYIENFKNAYGVKPIYIKDKETGDVHIFFDVSKAPANAKTGMTSAEYVINGDNVTTFRYYDDGKIVQDKENLMDPDHKVYSKFIQKPIKKGIRTEEVIMQSLPISISVDPSIYNYNSIRTNRINKFVKALEDNKSELMKDLNIDNDSYNEFAQLACAVAMQETEFGKGIRFYIEKSSMFAKDSVAMYNSTGHNFLGTTSTAVSKGLTQIKVGDWLKHPKVNKLFEKYGIEDQYGIDLSPEESAIATIIVLNEIKKQTQKPQCQDMIELANGRYYHTDSIRVDGEIVTQEGGYNLVNFVSEQDAMMYLYNGRASLRRGDATPAINEYTHSIELYKKMFTVKEDPAQRAAAPKSIVEISYSNEEEKVSSLSQDLGWGIGQVTFMPSVYTGGVSVNTDEEISDLRNFLLVKDFDASEVDRLIKKMKDGEISFFRGLTQEEMSSFTPNDLKLILRHSDDLEESLSTVTSAAEKRKLAFQADRDFKKEYLASHAKQYYVQNVAEQTVTLNDDEDADIRKYPSSGYNTGAQKRCRRYLEQLRDGNAANGGLYLYDNRLKNGLYTGFCVEQDKGINYSNTSKMNIVLAQNGADTANTLKTSGACLTGAKQALIGAGVVDPEEMTTFGNAYQLATFLEQHPDRFQEVKYVQISKDVAREITGADIASLPAGYIVVYGNKSRIDVAGHAAITSGNGQLYADETDNSNWDNFVSRQLSHNGKGEHGYVRVFRLNPDYYTYDPAKNSIVEI